MALTEIDRNLLKRCIAEERGAWKDFVDRFIGLFVHVIQHSAHARSVRLAPEDVDDLCAEIFLALLENDYAVLQRFRGKSSLATYLAIVARRIVVREIARRRKAEAFGHVNAHQASLQQARATNAEQQRIENRDELQRMLLKLPQRDAEVVRQFHVEGKTYREISSRLGIPENSIGPTLTRARELMRRRKVGWDLYGLLGIERGEKDKMARQHARNFDFFGAPVGIMFTIDRDLEIGSWLDYGMFLGQVMLAARQRGLHTCPQAAWPPYHKVVREVLAIPDDEILVCGMSNGVLDESHVTSRLVTERESVSGFATFHES